MWDRRSWLAIGLAVACGWSGGARADGPALKLTSPLDYQVFQRLTQKAGAIVVRGRLDGTSEEVRVRVALPGKTEAKWFPLSIHPKTREFWGEVAVPPGGWYRVEVEADGKTVAVEHVGLGEVFVVSGQSNSANYGDERLKTETGLVSSFSGDRWRLANDPQPGVQDGSGGGSFIPAFGDALAKKYKVPVGIASVGYGGTSVRQWLPAGDTMDSEPTAPSFVKKTGGHEWTCDGTLFNGMLQRIGQLGHGGFRAVLSM